MLNKHLIAKTRPLACEQNVVFWKNYRLTVLQNALFRLERSENKKFRDDATQTVWFRDMPKQEFTVCESKDSLTVETSACSLILKEKREDCRILLNGKTLKINNDGNLKGTYRTLDEYDGNYHE